MKNVKDLLGKATDRVKRSYAAKSIDKNEYAERFEATLLVGFNLSPEFSEEDFIRLVRRCAQSGYSGGRFYIKEIFDCVCDEESDKVSYELNFWVLHPFERLCGDVIAYVMAVEENIKEGLEKWNIDRKYFCSSETFKIFYTSGKVVAI